MALKEPDMALKEQDVTMKEQDVILKEEEPMSVMDVPEPCQQTAHKRH